MSNASFELPNAEVIVVDGYNIDLSNGVLDGQTLIYNAETNSFEAGTAAGTVSGSFTNGEIAIANAEDSLTSVSNFKYDTENNSLFVDGDGYFTGKLTFNGSAVDVSDSGTGAIRFNLSSNHLEFSENGGNWTEFGTGSGDFSIGSSVSGGTSKSILFIDGSNELAQDNSNFVWDYTNNRLGIGLTSPSATLDITQQIATTGSPIALKLTGAAHTTLTASSEAPDVYLNLARTVQFNGGALSTQRAILITAPTYSFTSSSTLTTAATLTVQNAPQAGTNATITRAYSFWAQAGVAAFDEHIKIDGYTIDLSGGVSTNQALVYNGTSFVASGIIGGNTSATSIPYSSGTNTLANSQMSWDNTNKILTLTTITGNTGVIITDSTRSVAMAVTSSAGQLGTTSNHRLEFFTNNSAAQMTLSTSGYLGIGGSPSYQLHVVGDGYFTSRTIYNASNASVSPTGTGAIRYNVSTNHLEFSEDGGAWQQFGTAAESAMTIGNIVNGGTADAILFVDPDGYLGQDATNFTWDGYTLQTRRDDITTTNVWGVQLVNDAVTTNPTPQQYSPGINFKYHQWNNSADKINEWLIQAQGLSGVNAGGRINFMTRQDETGSFISRFTMSSNRSGDTFLTVADPTITTVLAIYDVAEFNSSANHGVVGTTSAHDFVIRTNATGRARWDTNGNYISGPIGIGTGSSAPSVPLEVKGASTNQAKIYTTLSSGYADISFANTGGTNQVAFGYGNASVADTTRQSRGFIYTGTNNFVITDGTTAFYLLTQSTGQHTFTQPISSSGVPTGILFTGAAHTTLTASTEAIDININLARTVQHAQGALTTQRGMVVQAPTYSFDGPSTLTTAATFAVTNAPQQGANATLTNSYSIWAQAGVAAFDEHIKVDGYVFDLSGGASQDQVVAYDGTKFVAADLSGVTFPGSLADDQIAFGNGTDTIAGSNNLTYNGTTLTIAGHISVDGYLIDISGGASTNQVLAYDGSKFVAANPGSGTINGSIASNQVAYGSGADTIQGSANLTYDGTTLTIAQHISVDGYTIDLSAGASNGQAIVYDSVAGKFKAGTVSGGPGGGFGSSGETLITVVPIGKRYSHNTNTELSVGAIAFNPVDYSLTSTALTLKFRAIAAVSELSLTGYVRIRNITDSEDVATLTFTSTNAAKQEASLTIGSSTGNIKNSEKIYEARIWVDNAQTSDDTIELYSCEIRTINTID